MSDDESYEYDDEMEEEIEYTDEEEEKDDAEVALENAYYNAKGLRETSTTSAAAAFEQVIADERDQIGHYGPWSYKSMRQLVKLHFKGGPRSSSSSSSPHLDQENLMKYYQRLLDCISTEDSQISPAAVDKGINGMLERVASLHINNGANSASALSLSLAVYDATLKVFHPQSGSCRNDRLWFKTNLKYGQLLYETNETAKLQLVLKELKNAESATNNSSGSTNTMEVYALQMQLYSRQKDTKKLRETFHKAMSVRGGIPHPRTVALIQELGGKMYMTHSEYASAEKAFFQAFKSYDEAGDPSRLRCLKYLVLASMLHASRINPFDSQEARPYRDDPEIVAMTNLVQAFHSNEIQTFERILRQKQGRLMEDEFVREHVEALLRTIRTQVLRVFLKPYSRISLQAISHALNDIPVKDVENLLVNLILEGTLKGKIDLTLGILVKEKDTRSEAVSLQCREMEGMIAVFDELARKIGSARGAKESSSTMSMMGGSGLRSMF